MYEYIWPLIQGFLLAALTAYSIFWTAFSPNPNAFSKTTSLMPELNNATACICVPGFWLFRAAIAVAVPSHTLSSKCKRPLGNTNTSPFCNVAAKSVPLVLTKPTNKEPSTTKMISVARGCVWGGTRPPLAKSSRAMEIPKVLMPGNWAAAAGVTKLPRGLLVFPGVAKRVDMKSPPFTRAGFLQTRPLTKVGLLRSATQKSCSGSASDAMAMKGRRASCNTKSATVTRRTWAEKLAAIVLMDAGCESAANRTKLVNLDAARQKAIEPVVLVCRKKGCDRQGKQCKKKSLVCSAVGMGSVCSLDL